MSVTTIRRLSVLMAMVMVRGSPLAVAVLILHAGLTAVRLARTRAPMTWGWIALELPLVGADLPDVLGALDLELDLLAQEAVQQVRELGQGVVELKELRAQRLLARERKQLANQARRTVRGVAEAGQQRELLAPLSVRARNLAQLEQSESLGVGS